jgi:predicted GIY-YIG superfamily endonuclease
VVVQEKAGLVASQAIEAEDEHWLTKARRVARRIRAATRDAPGAAHHVYIVLLEGCATAEGDNGLYVGQSYYSPEERFRQHKEGHRASRIVNRCGVRLLPKLYQHLNPLTQAEALEIEARLAEAFKEARLPNVRGGH